jgi:DNA-binding XRE family transcriptional regulator
MMKEFELTLRLKNNLIKQRRVARGLTTTAAAEQAGVSYVNWINYEGLKLSPLHSKRGGWKTSATLIAKFFGCLEEDLFPT